MQRLLVILGLLLIAWLPLSAAAAQKAGIVLFSKGDITAVDTQGFERKLAKKAIVFEGDTIKTGPGARAAVRWVDGGFLRLGQSTEMKVDRYRFKKAKNDGVRINFVKGFMRMLTGAVGKSNPDAVNIKTRVGTIGIRGTDFVLSLGGTNTNLIVRVLDGVILFSNSAGTRAVTAGGTASVANISTPPAAVTDNVSPETLDNLAEPLPTEDVAAIDITDIIAEANAEGLDTGDIFEALDAILPADQTEQLLVDALAAVADDPTAVEDVNQAAEDAGIDAAIVEAANETVGTTQASGTEAGGDDQGQDGGDQGQDPGDQGDAPAAGDGGAPAGGLGNTGSSGGSGTGSVL